jgi:hypothetical protein
MRLKTQIYPNNLSKTTSNVSICKFFKKCMGHLYFLSVQQEVVIYNRCQCVTRVCTCLLGEVMGPYSSNRLVSPNIKMTIP